MSTVCRQDSNEIEVTAVKRSYSRATFHSFCLTPYHSGMAHNLVKIMIDTCEFRVAAGEVEIPQNQIPPSALAPLD